MIKKLVLILVLCVIWMCSPVFATDVYYSVSPRGTTDDLKVACNIEITGGAGVATFSVAQTGNIGIGLHVLSSGIDGYISVMTNSTTATIVTALGAAHGNVASEALTSIKHEYASLSAAEAGFIDASHINTTNLTTEPFIVNLTCYYDDDDGTLDTTACTFTGNTTDATGYINVYTPTGGTESINSQRDTTTRDGTTAYQITNTSSDVITLTQASTKITGLQVKADSTSAFRDGIVLGTVNDLEVHKSIIFLTSSATTSYGINGGTPSGTGVKIFNNIIYDFNTTSSLGVWGAGGDNETALYNNTIFDCTGGVQTSASDTIARNNAVFSNSDDWIGTFAATSSHNASDDDDMGTSKQQLDATSNYANEFTDHSTNDVTLVTGGVCEENGVDLSGSGVTDDILDVSRPVSTNYDIGAFEGATGGVSIFIPSIRFF